MNILGINGGANTLQDIFFKDIIHGQYHDSSSALLKNGVLLFASEEERLTRIKHTNHFPKNAINETLAYNNLHFENIDFFAFAQSQTSLINLSSAVLKNNMITGQGSLLILKDIFKKHTGYGLDINKIKLYSHHYCHAISTFFQSGYDESLVVTLDGAGEGLSGSAYIGKNGKLKKLKEYPVSKSLGHFYLEITEFLGMSIFDEYKVMGLASYGNPVTYEKIFENFYKLLPNGNYEIYFDKIQLLNTICPKRNKEEAFNQKHKDIAASIQYTLEVLAFHIISTLKAQTGLSKLCLAGGVALNCKMIGKLLYSNMFDDIFVFPASGDNGLSTGAAIACHLDINGSFDNKKLKSVSLGIKYSEEHIARELDNWSELINYQKQENIFSSTADLLAQNEIIGWFSGREEYGPRALGNRSILADPRPKENKDRINAIVKMREGFRPFAPAIMEEFVGEFFKLPTNNKKDYSFMSVLLYVQEAYKSSLGAVVHEDGTARLQTVSRNDNAGFWELINAFYKNTKMPVLLNTSFNNNYEPIVHSPSDAITFLLTSSINYIVIDDYLIEKKGLDQLRPIHISIQLPPHITLRADTADQNQTYLLENIYLKEKFAISKELYEILSYNKLHVFNQVDSPLYRELMNLWRKRILIIIPQ